MKYERPPNATRCKKEAIRFLGLMEKGDSEMPITEKSLYGNFTDMEEKVCQRKCYYKLFLQSSLGKYCRNCEMQKFKEVLRRYCDNREDDGK